MDPEIVMAKILCGPLRNTTVVPLGSQQLTKDFFQWCKDSEVADELSRKGINVSSYKDLETTLSKRIESK